MRHLTVEEKIELAIKRVKHIIKYESNKITDVSSSDDGTVLIELGNGVSFQLTSGEMEYRAEEQLLDEKVKEKIMKGINVHNLEVVIKNHIERDNIDLGALTLSCDNREYMMDVVQSYTDYTEDLGGDEITRITCYLKVEPDREVFPECKFDFKKDDLFDHDRNMTLYVGGDDGDFVVESIHFHFDIDGQDYELKVLEE